MNMKNIKFINVAVPYLRDHLVTVLNGKLFLIGGVLHRGTEVTINDRIFICDISTNIWSIHPNRLSYSVRRNRSVLITEDKHITIIVSHDDGIIKLNEDSISYNAINIPDIFTKHKTTYVPDIGIVAVGYQSTILLTTDYEFVRLPKPSIATTDHAVISSGEYVYKLGGKLDGVTPISEIEVLDMNQGIWLKDVIDYLPRTLYGHTVNNYYKNSFIITGGYSGEIIPRIPIVYDTVTGNTIETNDLLYDDITGYDNYIGVYTYVEDNYQQTLVIYV